jgi:hypothetical protein
MNYEMESEDEEIVDGMHALEQGKFYRKYISDRFMVDDLLETEYGLCAVIVDQEMGVSDKYHTGDELADGTVEVLQTGVLFKPYRADLASIPLHSKMEMSPLYGHIGERAYSQMVEDVRHEPLELFGDEDDEGLVIMVLNDQVAQN